MTGAAGDGTLVRRPALSTDLAAAVVQMISVDGLEPGQAIPALRPLAQRFGVAVPTMRESLRRLEGLGILEFRHGSGIYVGPNADRMVLANVLAPSPTPEKLAALLEARMVIEPPIAAMAAAVRHPDGLDQLQQTLDRAGGYLRAQDPRLAQANLDLHRSIATTTGNSVLAETLDSLAMVHAVDQAEILVLHGDPAHDYAEHAEIVEHVRAGDADAAHSRMHDHLHDVLQIVRSRTTVALPERSDEPGST